MNRLLKLINKKRKPIKVIYVSTYIPQKCGIATFTKDVTNAINLINPYALAELMAVVKENEEVHFPWEVKFKIRKDELNTYLVAADYVNNSCCDVVMIEHEFGIFGGKCGEYIVPFIEAIHKPVIATLHTIPEDPQSDYGALLKRLGGILSGVTVMLEQSKKKLIKEYGFDRRKIIVIPHGTPDIPYAPTERYKTKKGIKNRFVLANVNLLSENKGLEYTVEALKKIVKKIPSVLYVIIGQTHPAILERDGEKYRNFLKTIIKKNGLEKNVRFVNKYVTLEDLIDWLKSTDIYITPYLDPQQSSSGALAYAVGAGKPCISSPYRYAKEVLGKGRGVLVPFKNSNAIANAVIDLWENQEKREGIQKKAYEFGRFMTWSSVALQHLDMFEAAINRHKKICLPRK